MKFLVTNIEIMKKNEANLCQNSIYIKHGLALIFRSKMCKFKK